MMTGKQMDEQILAWIKEYGLVGHHDWDSRRTRTGRGWPDWEIIGSRIIYRECKGTYDVLSINQRRVARAIMGAGGDWAVWWPKDFTTGRVLAELVTLSLVDV